MLVKELFAIIIGAIFINNFVLGQFLGICPFLGVSKKMDSAVGMGFAVIFVLTIASMVSWVINYTILVPYHIEFLRTITFILVIASLVQLVEMAVAKFSPTLHQALGIFLPLITTNCAVLGAALILIQKEYNFIESVIFGLAAGLGFTLTLVLMAGLREKLELVDLPPALRGLPIAFILAGIMSLAFLGFSGMQIG